MIKKVGIRLLIMAISMSVLADEVSKFNNYEKISPQIHYLPQELVSNNLFQQLQSLLPNSFVMSSSEYSTIPIVVGGDNRGQVGFSFGDTIYLKEYYGNIGSKMAIISNNGNLFDYDTKEPLGIEYVLSAYGVITGVESGVASMSLTNVIHPVSIGDKAIPVTDTLAYEALSIDSDIVIYGRIIKINDSILSAAMMNTIAINKGYQDGVKSGMLLDILDNDLLKDPLSDPDKPQYLTLPEQVIGEALVYSVCDKVSFGLVVSSRKEIPIYAKIRSRKYE